MNGVEENPEDGGDLRQLRLKTKIDDIALADQLGAIKRTVNAAQHLSAALEPLVSACEAAATWSLDYIAKARRLCREAGREALARKSMRHAEESAALNHLCEDGIRLQQVRAFLATKFNFSRPIFGHFWSLVQTLSEARSIFRLFISIPNCEAAAKVISLSVKYANKSALQSLDDLISFRRQSDAFLRLAEASGLFGLYYRGIKSYYRPHQRITRYFSETAEHFGRSEHATLRAFLREAQLKRLDLLPRHSTSMDVPLTYTFLRSRLRISPMWRDSRSQRRAG